MKFGSEIKGFKTRERKPVRVTPADLLRISHSESWGALPLLIEPKVEEVDLCGWLASNREFIEEQLAQSGAILFRNFAIHSADHFAEVARAVSGELLDYNERAAPRVEVRKNIFTSTEYPADQTIRQHHEMSYAHNWPSKIWFYCVQPAEEGGRTPLADDRKVFDLIDPKIKERFIDKKVMYIRNYSSRVDLPWQDVFQTTDRSAVERYCRSAEMDFEWLGEDGLRTRAVRQSVAAHPKTGELVWFNHAHMFHASSLEPAVRHALLSQFEADELPRNAFYGDGSPFEDAVLDEIREIYRQAAVSFAWQPKDVLMVDNLLITHGREPYVGPRRILVAMTELSNKTHLPIHIRP